MFDETALDPDIRGQSRSRDVEAQIAALAGRRHGVVSRAQLVALGLGRRAIEHRLERGRLHLLHRGVYAMGHRAVTRGARWLAAVLAAGSGAVLSHHSAAPLWGIRPTSRTRIDVTAPRKLQHAHHAVLAPDETTAMRGIPVDHAAAHALRPRAGRRVVRITWRQLHENPAALAAELRALGI